MSSPLSLAHSDGGIYGTPKTYCENLKGDTNVHDYAVGAPLVTGSTLAFMDDGNLADCDFDGVPGDYDGHSEWAPGGAILLASENNGVTNGATMCFGEAAHHVPHSTIWAFDHISWEVEFLVAVDSAALPGNPCGDGVLDQGVLCFISCVPNFPPGLDGAYHVFPLHAVHVHTGSVNLLLTEHAACVPSKAHFDGTIPPPPMPKVSVIEYTCLHTASLGHVYD